MKNLREMIDDSTERLLRKVDEISIGNPADVISDKKEENYKKEIERLQKQLDIAVNTLKCYANPDNWDYNRFTNFFATWKLASDNLEKIKELDNVSR